MGSRVGNPKGGDRIGSEGFDDDTTRDITTLPIPRGSRAVKSYPSPAGRRVFFHTTLFCYSPRCGSPPTRTCSPLVVIPSVYPRTVPVSNASTLHPISLVTGCVAGGILVCSSPACRGCATRRPLLRTLLTTVSGSRQLAGVRWSSPLLPPPGRWSLSRSSWPGLNRYLCARVSASTPLPAHHYLCLLPTAPDDPHHHSFAGGDQARVGGSCHSQPGRHAECLGDHIGLPGSPSVAAGAKCGSPVLAMHSSPMPPFTPRPQDCNLVPILIGKGHLGEVVADPPRMRLLSSAPLSSSPCRWSPTPCPAPPGQVVAG